MSAGKPFELRPGGRKGIDFQFIAQSGADDDSGILVWGCVQNFKEHKTFITSTGKGKVFLTIPSDSFSISTHVRYTLKLW